MNGKEPSRTPIRGAIKRLPGQSTREMLDNFVDDEALLAVLPLGLCVFWLFVELGTRLNNQRVSIWLIVALTMLAAINFGIRFLRIRRRAARFRQGMLGEQYVAQIIERDLIPQGYRAFHDLAFANGERKFNIDHLLVGPNGVFCIETKTWSKPMKGETVAVFDGEQIYLNGAIRQQDVVGQACALSNEASRQIKKLTGHVFKVVPVIVVVGWYVRKNYAGMPKVLVVNEEALSIFIQNVKAVLAQDEVRLIVEKLSQVSGNAKEG